MIEHKFTSYVNVIFLFLQLEGFIRENFSTLDLPPAQDTIFEYLVNENGEWEHWDQRVMLLRHKSIYNHHHIVSNHIESS